MNKFLDIDASPTGQFEPITPSEDTDDVFLPADTTVAVVVSGGGGISSLVQQTWLPSSLGKEF